MSEMKIHQQPETEQNLLSPSTEQIDLHFNNLSYTVSIMNKQGKGPFAKKIGNVAFSFFYFL